MSIDITVAGTASNSYLSVSSANTYFNARSMSEGWSNILVNSTGTTTATTKKEGYLKQATREIDSAYRFKDTKYNSGIKGATDYQALQFPRYNHTDVNGTAYIHQDIQDAVCEQILWILERGGKKVTKEGNPIPLQIIGEVTYDLMKKYITTRIEGFGRFPTSN